MIKSMTGFGQVTTPIGEATLQIEIKTLNSKFLDLSIRIPRVLSEKEVEIRSIITEKLERGKVSVSIEYIKAATQEIQQQYNEAMFVAHYAELKKLADKVMAPYDNLFELALKSPEVQQTQEREAFDVQMYERFVSTLKEALDQCDSFRKTEGSSLVEKFQSYISSIAGSLIKVEKIDPLRIEKIRTKIKKGITDFFGDEGFDSNRLEQEIIFYIEKLDIHEERVRLKTHLDYFLKVMKEPQSNGKKLAFLAQEIGREINTIGSKANDAEMQKEVVNMKEELEKIKEQLNNVL
ncbi:MAG: YicC family protein [Cyclobacteriaceae bacterium]|nr:YicC family protein [Cyclobacteriaceae bacterium]